ncbi:O-antigen/teichoic acid export membrane protein [Microbacterium natoriense]|uniref:O-antigen/teichoic acid export membrane protein n=1 Tax=Microbacterium natoriense TaxID=284570 RepID=A0AAW8EWW5_9MICO|nr:oligosaccharide flippase family protein [Microbacterium natoriense]MDQ0647752.1 O-antigen/teichoic acid export membrane protein [Microbacterium natoriense]
MSSPLGPRRGRARKAIGHELVRRSLLFSLSIVLSTLVGVVSIPVLIGQLGDTTWARLAVLQSISQFLAVIVGFGWGATGPSTVASLPDRDRKEFFVTSLLARVIILLPVLVAGTLIAAAIVHIDPLVAALAALTSVAPAAGAAWYFIGTNRPVALFLFDALPAILGQAAALVGVLVAPSLLVYVASTASFAVLGLLASCVFVATRSADGPWRIDRSQALRGLLQDQMPGFTATFTTSLITTLPVVIVKLIVPASALPLFVLADRLSRYAGLVLAPILQAIQSWVPEAGREHIRSRARIAMLVACGIGFIGAVGMITCAPWVAPLLSQGAIAIPPLISVAMGLGFAGEAISQITGLAVLVTIGRSRALALSAGVATVAALLGVLVGTLLLDVPGALIALALTSIGLAIYRSRVALLGLAAT